MNTETTTKWAIDPSHTEIQFKVKHLMITTVTGSFTQFEGSAQSNGDDFTDAEIEFKANIASISTNSEQRDAHLKSDDFFSAETYPYLTFSSGKLIPTGEKNKFTLAGDLTIRDVTKSIQLHAELGGIGNDPWGNTKAGFSLSGTINRKDFGLTWNAATETGGVLVSDEIKLVAEVQLAKQ